MNKILRLAGRNLTRQKRRNVILAAAIAFGFFVVTCIDGLTTGMVSNLEDQIAQLNGGTVFVAGIECEKSSDPDGKNSLVQFARDSNFVPDLVEKIGIDYKYVSKYTSSAGTLLFNGQKVVSTIFGRDFSEKDFVESLQIVEGSLDSLVGATSATNKPVIILPDKTAENMNVQVGDQIIYTSNDIHGQKNVIDFTVIATIKTNSIMNTLQAYVPLATLNEFEGLPPDGYSMFSIYLKNKNQAAAIANKIEAAIRAEGQLVTSRLEAAKTNPTNIGKGLEKQFDVKTVQWDGTMYAVETLDDEVPAMKTVMNVVHTVTTVILLVILLIVMVGVSNTYRMVLLERIREIGTMRALGMSGKDTGRVFTTEAVILCLLGACAGLILAAVTMAIIHLFPIANESLSFFLNKGHFTFQLSLGSIIIQYILLIVLTTLAVRGSAKNAARMSPAQALRTVK